MIYTKITKMMIGDWKVVTLVTPRERMVNKNVPLFPQQVILSCIVIQN